MNWALLPFVVLFALPAGAAELPVTTETIAREGEFFAIEFSYPATGLAAIDTDIKVFVDKTVADFMALTEEEIENPYRIGLDAGFEVLRNDDRWFALAIAEESATGGAHPNHGVTTFNYLMPDGWRVYLPELFEAAALQRISDLAIAELAGEEGEEGSTDIEWIREGAGPFWDNFKHFVLLPDALEIRFPEYQVAPYVAGEQTVTIPLSELAGSLRKDPRRPVASFDCAKAATPTEVAVCSDVALSRLDRDIATAYRWKLKLAGDDAARAEVTRGQQDWLGERDGRCGGDVACLARAYSERLKALDLYAG